MTDFDLSIDWEKEKREIEAIIDGGFATEFSKAWYRGRLSIVNQVLEDKRRKSQEIHPSVGNPATVLKEKYWGNSGQ